MPLMMLAMTANSGAGVDFVRMSATICEVAGSLPPVTRVTSMLSFATAAVFDFGRYDVADITVAGGYVDAAVLRFIFR